MKPEKAGTLLYYGGDNAYMTDDTSEIYDMLESYAYPRVRVYYCDPLNDIQVMVVTDYAIYIGYDEDEMYEANEWFAEMGCS